jgi:lipid-binding SYLF domain-containing protein
MRKLFNTLIYVGLSLGLAAPVVAQEAGMSDRAGSAEMSEEKADAKDLVRDAAEIVQRIKSDPEAREALSQARAAYIVPNYGRAAFWIGGAGGQGVLTAQNQGTWSPPAFYNMGAITAGLAAGIEGGSIAFLIMSDEGLEGFRNQQNFALSAEAGLTIVNWSERGQLTAGEGVDVVVWSDTAGLYGDVAVTASDIFWDEEANRAYYNRDVTAADIVQGNVEDPVLGNPLRSEFSALEQAGGQTPARTIER